MYGVYFATKKSPFSFSKHHLNNFIPEEMSFSDHTLHTQMPSSKNYLCIYNSLPPSIPTIQLLIIYSLIKNEQILWKHDTLESLSSEWG